MDINTKNLREYLTEKFSVEDFSTFLFDYFPQVYNEITPEMRQSTRIQLLLAHCKNHGPFPDLLANLTRERPGSFHPQDFSNTPLPQPASESAKTTKLRRNPRQIFISYANQDGAIATQLAHALQANGWEIWIAPDSIRPGEKWVEAINRGLAESGVFVLVLTEHAVNSRWVNSETNAAINMEHRGKIRLLILADEFVDAPPLWEAYQHISLRDAVKQRFLPLVHALNPRANKQPRSSKTVVREPVPAKVRRIRKPDPEKTTKDVFVDAKTGKEMICIPAGAFLYGDENETIHLDEYWIAKTPVTNADYARFVAETGHEPPSHWKNNKPSNKIADHPVVQVSWYDAKAYADWAKAKLPTEQQWEKAARCTDGRVYPWGNEWHENHCNTYETGINGTTPVGQYSPQGDSPYGCVDMSGNVREWTASQWKEGSDRRVLRGGSWYFVQYFARASYRSSSTPDYRYDHYGFRVVVRRPPS